MFLHQCPKKQLVSSFFEAFDNFPYQDYYFHIYLHMESLAEVAREIFLLAQKTWKAYLTNVDANSNGLANNS